MHNYKDSVNQELAAFIASSLAFGRREQIIEHVKFILDMAEGNIAQWITSGSYRKVFTEGEKSFYRMYSHNSMIEFFDTLKTMLVSSSSIGEYIRVKWLNACREQVNGNVSYPSAFTGKPLLCFVISSMFDERCALIPHTQTSSCKKVNMFIRWMVRTSSPVDLGLWTWYDRKDLLIPLDTHVMTEASNFNLIPRTSSGKIRSARLKTCMELTDELRKVFPDDPARGDFALFGLGVDDGR